MPAHVKVTIVVLAHRRRSALHAVDFNMLTSANSCWKEDILQLLGIRFSVVSSQLTLIVGLFLFAFGLLTVRWGYPYPPPPAIGTIGLQAKTLKIFEFKGVIWKIFRNKVLTRSIRCAQDFGSGLALRSRPLIAST